LARDAKDLNMLSQEWIYENIFRFSDDQIEDEKNKVVEDVKQKFRLTQIESEGNDPTVTSESFGTRHDLAIMDYAKKNKVYDEDSDNKNKIDARTISLRPGKKHFNEKSLTHIEGGGSASTKFRGSPLRREQIEYKLKRMGINIDKKRVIKETFNLKDKKNDNGTFLDENNIIGV